MGKTGVYEVINVNAMPTPSQQDPALRKPSVLWNFNHPSSFYRPPSHAPQVCLTYDPPPYGPFPATQGPSSSPSGSPVPSVPRHQHPRGKARQSSASEERSEGWTSAAAESVRPPRGEGPSFRLYPPPSPSYTPHTQAGFRSALSPVTHKSSSGESAALAPPHRSLHRRPWQAVGGAPTARPTREGKGQTSPARSPTRPTVQATVAAPARL